jgi:lysophospholipase L1-like esterase
LLSDVVRIETFEVGRADRYPAAQVQQRSDALRRRVGDLAAELELGFVDATPALRAAASRAPIHGPRDDRHFNRHGYEALAGAIAARLAPSGTLARE